jgi:hypothetical protein
MWYLRVLVSGFRNCIEPAEAAPVGFANGVSWGCSLAALLYRPLLACWFAHADTGVDTSTSSNAELWHALAHWTPEHWRLAGYRSPHYWRHAGTRSRTGDPNREEGRSNTHGGLMRPHRVDRGGDRRSHPPLPLPSRNMITKLGLEYTRQVRDFLSWANFSSRTAAAASGRSAGAQVPSQTRPCAAAIAGMQQDCRTQQAVAAGVISVGCEAGEQYEVSMARGKECPARRAFRGSRHPRARRPLVLADGFSCRSQISSRRRPRHAASGRGRRGHRDGRLRPETG